MRAQGKKCQPPQWLAHYGGHSRPLNLPFNQYKKSAILGAMPASDIQSKVCQGHLNRAKHGLRLFYIFLVLHVFSALKSMFSGLKAITSDSMDTCVCETGTSGFAGLPRFARHPCDRHHEQGAYLLFCMLNLIMLMLKSAKTIQLRYKPAFLDITIRHLRVYIVLQGLGMAWKGWIQMVYSQIGGIRVVLHQTLRKLLLLKHMSRSSRFRL